MGEDILSHCRQMVALAGDIESLIASKRSEPCGTLRVASSISFGQSYLAEALGRFMQHYPRVSVEMLLADRPINLVEERIDLAIQVGDNMELWGHFRLLTRCESVVCASPAYLAQHGTPQSPNALHRAPACHPYPAWSDLAFCGPRPCRRRQCHGGDCRLRPVPRQ